MCHCDCDSVNVEPIKPFVLVTRQKETNIYPKYIEAKVKVPSFLGEREVDVKVDNPHYRDRLFSWSMFSPGSVDSYEDVRLSYSTMKFETAQKAYEYYRDYLSDEELVHIARLVEVTPVLGVTLVESAEKKESK